MSAQDPGMRFVWRPVRTSYGVASHWSSALWLEPPEGVREDPRVVGSVHAYSKGGGWWANPPRELFATPQEAAAAVEEHVKAAEVERLLLEAP